MTGYDPDRHHRRSIRLKGYDYTQPGAYFITLCTHERAHLFGRVVEGKMVLNEFGEIVREEWFRSADIRAEIELHPDEFVVMPNHIHGIVWIVDNAGATGRNVGATAPNVGATGRNAGAAGPNAGATGPNVGATSRSPYTNIPHAARPNVHYRHSSPGSNPPSPPASTNAAARPARPSGNAIITNTSSATM